MVRRIKNKVKRLGVSSLTLMLSVVSFAVPVQAAGYEDLDAGVYEVQADFSAYVNAMGGVEFGEEVYDSTYITVNEDRSAQVTMGFKKGVVSIYGVTCDVFVDPNYPLQYYHDGRWIDIDDYTVSGNTALDSDNTPVHYVKSVTFDLPEITSSYDFGLYINSNVMGVQFGSGSSYYSGFSIDWSSAQASEGYHPSNRNTATVSYTVPSVSGEYEVAIPALITVDSETRTGEYTVEAVRMDLSEDGYLKVNADTSGVLSSETNSVDFVNELEDTDLYGTGDILSGVVTVTELAANAGTYTGTINFTIEIEN